MPKDRIVTVPFSYDVEHVPKGKRNPRIYHVLDQVKVVLPDLAAAEAPTALRFVPKEWRHGEPPADHPWWNGRLWGPWSRVASGESERAATIAELERSLELTKTSGDGYYSPFPVSPHKPYNAEFVALKDLPPGRTEPGAEAARAEKIAAIERRAAEMIVVDGKIYLPAVEPVYMIEHLGGMFGGRDTGEPAWYLKTMASSEVTANHRPDSVFRVDRFEEAVDVLERMESRRRGHHGLDPLTREQLIGHVVWNRVEVLLPEAVRFRHDLRPRLAAAADEAFGEMRKDIAERDEDYFRVYAELRALLRAEPRDHEAIAALLRDRALPALREAHGHLAQRLDGVMEEWVANRDDPSAVSDADLVRIGAA